ncbi:MAG: thioredoxin family protein, partial [Planctomyces sp.]|nr:thioredoxin family protein [Planctomyces sp.]
MLRQMLLFAFCSVISLHSCFADPGSMPQNGFEQSYESAKERAASFQLPLLIHFQAFYCGPCRQMDSQVFSSSDVQTELGRGLVAVQIDVTQHPDLAGDFNASTVPRDVVVYPNGKTETLQIGFVPRASYIAMLNRIRSEGDRIRLELPSKPAPTTEPSDGATSEDSAANQPAGTNSTDSEEVTESTGETEEPLFLGLDGFCPVRLH